MKRPLDRILQFNTTRTVDYDCCCTVPLIAASANNKIQLFACLVIRLFELRDSSRDSLKRAFLNYRRPRIALNTKNWIL